MPKGHNNKGRSDKVRYFKLRKSLTDSIAWRSLTAREKSLFIAIAMRYNGFNNGDISMSVREAVEEVPCNKDSVKKLIQTLEERGLIERVQKGYLGPGTMQKAIASKFRITCEPTETKSATHDYREWRPEHPKNKSPSGSKG